MERLENVARCVGIKEMIKALLLSATLALSPGLALATSMTAEVLRIANAYGYGQWDTVDKLRFTFNHTSGTTTVSRAWEWDVRQRQVALETTGDNGPLRLLLSLDDLSQGDAGMNKPAFEWFSSDQAWLLFPLRMVWDNDANVTLGGERGLPIGKGRATRLVVTYSKESDSAFAGDLFEVFYGPVGGVDAAMPPPPVNPIWNDSPFYFRQWTFREDSVGRPKYAMTWEGYQRLGPLILSTERRSAFGENRVWFSDLSIQLKNSSKWISPGPVDLPRKR